MSQGHQQTKPTTHADPLEATIAATDKAIAQRTDLLMAKIDNDSMMAECRSRPRDLAQIKAYMSEQLKEFPQIAIDAIYEKPVGKDPTGEMKYATGLSIRAAEMLAEAYGFNKISVEVTPLPNDPNRVRVEAKFSDFQTCRVWTDAGILSRQYKTRQGGTGLIPEDRFYNLICKAEGSRRIREVILRSTSQGLRAWFYDECAKVQGTVLTEEQTNKILASFAGKGVTLEQLEAYLGRKKSMGWQIADRKRLIAIWTALDTGEATIGELFNGDTGSPEGATPAPPKQPPKTLDDLGGDEPRPTEAKPTQHMLDRMSERGITMDQVRGAIAQGTYIEMPGGERRYSHQGVTACVKDGTIITTWKGDPQQEPEAAGGPQTPAEAETGPDTPPQTPEGDPEPPGEPAGGSDDQAQAVMAKVAADIKKRRNPQIVHDNRGKWIEQLVVAGMNQATAEAKVQDLATERINHLQALAAEKEAEQQPQPEQPAEPPAPTPGPPQGGPNPMEPKADDGPADPADSPMPGSLDDLAAEEDAGGLF